MLIFSSQKHKYLPKFVCVLTIYYVSFLLFVKVHILWGGHKIWKTLPLSFDGTNSVKTKWKIFSNFFGLLRIFKLFDEKSNMLSDLFTFIYSSIQMISAYTAVNDDGLRQFLLSTGRESPNYITTACCALHCNTWTVSSCGLFSDLLNWFNLVYRPTL